MSLTLGEQMAMAILKGDRVAAYALADLLLEERARGDTPLDQGYLERTKRTGVVDGYSVYSWPEFKAFCKRAGILWDVGTRTLTITLQEDALLVVQQEYIGRDMGEQT